jgi:translation initiation factor IF-1
MPFSDLERTRLKKLLTAWTEEVPAHVRDKLRHGFRIGDNDAVIFETRPHYRPPTTSSHPSE